MLKLVRTLVLVLAAAAGSSAHAASSPSLDTADAAALANAACAAVSDAQATAVDGFWIVPGAIAHIVLDTPGQAPRHCLATGEGRVLTVMQTRAKAADVDRAFAAALGCLAQIPEDQQPDTVERIITDGNGTYAVQINVRDHNSWACIANQDGAVIKIIPNWQINV